MKRYVSMIVPVLTVVCLCACMAQPTPAETQITTQPITAPATHPETEPSTEPTKPEHSSLYIPGLPVEDVILYFNEVCLDAEYSTGTGDPSRVQKWEEPISYVVKGDCTPADMEVLEGFAQWLNGVEGFPGMYVAQEDQYVNLQIHFCAGAEIPSILGDDFYGADGGVTFWYRQDRIYDATICYSTDVSQLVRNSVILEEIYNGLGPVQDTWLRPDSIAYAGYSEPQSLTAVDELILKLLYHPEIMPGMNAAQCEAVIRALYY